MCLAHFYFLPTSVLWWNFDINFKKYIFLRLSKSLDLFLEMSFVMCWKTQNWIIISILHDLVVLLHMLDWWQVLNVSIHFPEIFTLLKLLLLFLSSNQLYMNEFKLIETSAEYAMWHESIFHFNLFNAPQRTRTCLHHMTLNFSFLSLELQSKAIAISMPKPEGEVCIYCRYKKQLYYSLANVKKFL